MNRGICSWSDRSGVSEQTWPRMERYCIKHGYKFITSSDWFEDDVQASWMKLKMLQRQSGLDYLVWFDDDIIITDTDVGLNYFISQMGDCMFGIMGDAPSPQPRRFVMNMGVILVKCGCESLKTLQDLWTNGLKTKWRKQKHLEQDYINRRYNRNESFRNNVYKFPYGTLQSYVRPRTEDKYLWKPGDFSAHITSMPFRGKIKRVQEFIQENNL